MEEKQRYFRFFPFQIFKKWLQLINYQYFVFIVRKKAEYDLTNTLNPLKLKQ